MKVNVLLYGSTANPLSIPATWPAQVVEVPDTAPTAVAPWQQMTVADYRTYVAAHQAEYDAWLAAQVAAKNSNVSTLATQYDAAITAMQNFDGIANPTTAQAVSAVTTHNKILLKLLPILRGMYLDALK